MKTKLTMALLADQYGVCRLEKGEVIPEWALKSDFFSITRTDDELSVVCAEAVIPANVICEKDWRMLKVLGPLDFSLIGILASISRTLADKGISIFALSTYDTDYILLKSSYLDKGIDALREAGFEIE